MDLITLEQTSFEPVIYAKGKKSVSNAQYAILNKIQIFFCNFDQERLLKIVICVSPRTLSIYIIHSWNDQPNKKNRILVPNKLLGNMPI